MMLTWVACIIGAYIIGSIPFGVMIGRLKGVDIRQHGSKNIGATNVGRVLGKKFGVMCFFLDAMKGAVPVAAAGILTGVFGHDAHSLTMNEMWLWLAVMAATVVGHMFSIFLRFAGGKGVATGFGAMLAMFNVLTFAAIGAIAVWYISLRLFRYVSLASMLAVISLPVIYLLTVMPSEIQDQPFQKTIQVLMHASPPFIGTAAIAVLVIYQHRTNIGRLRRGEEPKAGARGQRGDVMGDQET